MNRFKILAVLVLALIFACADKHECDCMHEIYGNWEATEFISLESASYPKKNDYNPTIKFNSDGTLDIKLDRNSCFGDFELSGETAINMSNAGCTEACCDSEFSLKFASMLSDVSSYAIEGDILKLNVSGWGWIELEYLSD